jgi:hypothetical protein
MSAASDKVSGCEASGFCTNASGLGFTRLENDGPLCDCHPCVNFAACGDRAPAKTIRADGIVSLCLGLPPLVIRKHVDDDGRCPICLTIDANATVVEQPAGCKHTVCLDCFKEVWFPVMTEDVEPEDFGMTRYPSMSWHESYKRWEAEFPDQYKLYADADAANDEANEKMLFTRQCATPCPVCRAAFYTPYY